MTVLSRHDRTRDQQTRADLSYTCLSAVPSRDLGRLNFTGAVLRNVVLAGAALDLGGIATFAGTDLRGANLADVNFFLRSDFTDADLTDVNASNAVLEGNFEGATLDGADFDGAVIFGLRAKSLLGASFVGATLNVAQLQDADLNSIDFTRADLSDSNLRGAYLCGTKLGVRAARRTDFTDAHLNPARPTQGQCLGLTEPADVTGADLRGALGIDLTGTTGRPAFGPNG